MQMGGSRSVSVAAGETDESSPIRSGLCWILFAAAVGAIVAGQLHWSKVQLRSGLPWMLGGILLAAVFAALAARRLRGRGPSFGGRLRPIEIAFLAVVVIGGGFLRFVALDRLPPGGFYDEVQYHRFAERILAGQRPVFIPDAPMPAFYFYLLAAAIQIAGKGLATVRGVSALLGTLTLPAFYFLARKAFAWPVAVASTVLLAGSRWHITFSRVVFSPAIIVPLLEVLAVLCLWRALEGGSWRDYGWLGVVMGIGLQTYYAFNFFPAVILVAVVTYAAREGWREFGPNLRRVVPRLALAVLVAGLLLIPLGRFAIREPGVFFQRSRAVAIWNPSHQLPWPRALWDNTASHLLMFNYLGDRNPRHNIPDAPMLNPTEGVLLALGLGVTIALAFRWPQAAWLAWFGVMLVPAILTIEAPQAHRAVGAIPAVYLLVGEALQYTYGLFARGRPRLRGALAGIAVVALSVAAASGDVLRYFQVQVRGPRAWQEFQADYHAVARFLRPLEARYDICVSALYDYPILKFYFGDAFPNCRFRLFEHLPQLSSHLNPGREGIVYVLEPIQKDLFPLFQDRYHNARLQEHHDPYGRLMFVSILVPRADIEKPPEPDLAQGGFLAAYYPNERWAGIPAIVRHDPAVLFHFHWHEEALPDPFTADWVASLHAEQSGDYVFDLTTSGPTLFLVDGQTVITTSTIGADSYSQEGTVRLEKGKHLLVLSYLENSYPSTISLLWQPPGGNRSPIPMRLIRPLPRQEYDLLRSHLPRMPGPILR